MENIRTHLPPTVAMLSVLFSGAVWRFEAEAVERRGDDVRLPGVGIAHLKGLACAAAIDLLS